MGDERIRDARREDLPAIVAMLADDPLGATRDRRAQIEGVRIAAERRGGGRGERLIGEAIRLTTDRRRPRALAFYERLGFRDTHHGLKLDLTRMPVNVEAVDP